MSMSRESDRESRPVRRLSGRWGRSVGLGVAVVGLISLMSGHAVSESGMGQELHRHWVGSGVPSVILGKGNTRNTSWRISVRRPKNGGAAGGSRSSVCLAEVVRTADGASSHGVVCGSLAPPGGYPLYTLSRVSVNGRGATIVGAVFGTSVRRVRFAFGPGPDQVRRTHALTKKKVDAARIPLLRYVTFGVPRSACIRGFTGYNEAGEVLFDTGRFRCDGPPVEEIPSES